MEENQPRTEAPSPSPQVTNKKKTSKGAVARIIILSIIALAGVGFGIYGMISQNQKVKDLEAQIASCTAANNGETTLVTCPDGTEISATANNMANEYKEVVDTVNSLTSNIKEMRDYIESDNSLASKAAGTNTYVPIKLSIKKETNRYDNVTKVAEDFDTLKANLINAGFSTIGTIPFRGSAGPQIDGYLNSETSIICGVINESDYYNNASHDYIILDCAKTSWTWLTKEDETSIKAFETAYYNKTGSYPRIMFNWDNKITDSEYKPYQNTWIGIGGGAGLFYRTSPEAEWQFFTGTQSELECSDYNTDDLKKAYLGEPCWDNGQSTVQL